MLLGGDAGLRLGEMIGLKQTDVDFRRHQITIQRNVYKGREVPTKSGKPRVVPMTDALEKALQQHRHLRGPRVLYRDDGRPVSAKRIHMWMKQAQKRAGLEQTSQIHILRHTFCSRLAMKNAPVRTIQELAGHQHLSTTLRYMHLTPGATHEAIKLLNPDARGGILETGTKS